MSRNDVTPARAPRVPLRVTLVALLVALVALALAATGAGATALLRSYLESQQDDELETLLRQRGVETVRAQKPTFTRPAPADVRREIARDCEAIIEALAD